MADSFKDVMQRLGKDLVFEIVTQLKDKNKVASKKLIESVSYEYREDISTLIIWAEDYFKFVELGRKPGKQPPLSKIKQWCTYRSISESAAYPIAKKIGMFGIPPEPTLEEVLTQRQLPFEKTLEDNWHLIVSQDIDEILSK
jgi:hypothetical protein